jgi:hypothetical protein
MRHHLVRWHMQYAQQGLVVIEVDGGRHERLDVFRRLVAEKGTRHAILWDRQNRNHERYGIDAWPRAYLIGVDGQVVWEGNPARVIHRPLALCELEALLEAELQQVEP